MLEKRKSNYFLIILSILLVISTTCGLLLMNNKTVKADGEKFVRFEDGFSSKTAVMRGSLFTDKDGIAVRYLKDPTTASNSFFFGTKLTVDNPTDLTVSNQALVVDINVLYLSSINIGVNTLFGAKNQFYYEYDGNSYVAKKGALDAYLSTPFYPSAYFDGSRESYDKIVIPMTNFADAGTELTIENLLVRNRATYSSTKAAKYVIRGAYIVDDFTIGEIIDMDNATRIYTPSSTNYTAYCMGETYSNAASEWVDVNFLKAGEALIDQTSTSANDFSYIRFPSAVIDSEGLADISDYTGFYFTVDMSARQAEGIADNLEFTWTLTDENNITYNTYAANKSTRIFSGGTVNTGSAKAITKSHSKVLYYIPFTAAASGAVVDEGFTSAGSFGSQRFKPYLHLNITKNAKIFGTEGVIIGIGNFTMVKDGTVYFNTFEKAGGENVSVTVSRKTALVGTDIVYKATVNEGNSITGAKLNDIELTASQLSSLTGDGLTVNNNNGNNNLVVTVDSKLTLINGESVEYLYGTSAILPTATETGKVFVGWKGENGELYYDGYELSMTQNVSLSAVFVDFSMKHGAAIRIKEESGLRFMSMINVTDLEAIKTLVGEENVELGMRVVRGDNTYLDILAVNTVIDEDNLLFNGVIIGIAESNYNVAYTGRAYLEIKYSDASVKRVMAIADDNTRTIKYIAEQALADTTKTYTAEQLAILNKYAGV